MYVWRRIFVEVSLLITPFMFKVININETMSTLTCAEVRKCAMVMRIILFSSSSSGTVGARHVQYA